MLVGVAELGWLVGRADTVGAAVGLLLGWAEGALEGWEDGFTLGAVVGLRLGACSPELYTDSDTANAADCFVTVSTVR